LILPRISSAQAALAALSSAGPLTPSTLQAIEAVSQWARATPGAHGALRSDTESTESEVRGALARLAAENEDGTEWSSLLKRTLATQLGELLTEFSDAKWLADALKNPYATSTPRPGLEPPSRRTLSGDRGLALRSAFAAITGTLIACALWI